MSIVLEGFNPKRLVSANKRIHHHTRADLCRGWRGLAYHAARDAYGLADAGESWHQKVRIVITVRYPDGRGVKDPANLYPYVGKPLVDGLVDARVIPADDYRHVIGPDMRRDKERGPHRIVIEVIDADLPACGICGDPLADPAECPDRHGWEDHCLPCMGACGPCQHRLDIA